ncbi:carboxylating nicotinate-nucleotide diphosphorylase [Hoyosella rhizosphaerae]|uniref:Nicotinate-nucleotide pyrophosphorylase [carboxylating] n=1 Tax=Hoyosella rhizosphaerae TaxID=1755582 RepID=A0A916UFW5_9ACTN|nr:carboxylating nicotinate-nucleotide diphosphorylase [Hoyosella rhizosphaerae]MBN4925585.1 carboxylating nicotinate-nucleotide diphosphorylase [Hoyosella rhizosphaerae]GGC69497.1 nicotinate-nucleotide diphosphorylase (carboxylating) [Hoyosella rhizosphaerae]
MPKTPFALTEDERTVALRVVRTALDEDLRLGPDITTLATVAGDASTEAQVRTRVPGVIAGIEIARMVLDEVIGASEYTITQSVSDGDRVSEGDVIIALTAPTRGLLTAERTLLNILCHLSGIASETARWVDAIEGTSANIRDTRKTLPGLRALQKYAVRVGGGVNHRMALGDAALIKDNHVAAAGSITAALDAVRTQYPDAPCEVEVDSLEQLDDVLKAGAELVLLDNFPVWQTQVAVQRRNAIAPETKLESSGGLSIAVAREYAATGVDYLAIGALTHSVSVMDLGLDMD